MTTPDVTLLRAVHVDTALVVGIVGEADDAPAIADELARLAMGRM